MNLLVKTNTNSGSRFGFKETLETKVNLGPRSVNELNNQYKTVMQRRPIKTQ